MPELEKLDILAIAWVPHPLGWDELNPPQAVGHPAKRYHEEVLNGRHG
jgi:hypothetical protein